MVDFFGRPIIDWVIETAWESDLFDQVIVSTDDKGIYDHAKLKAYAVMRPKEIQGDVPEDAVLKHAMDAMSAKEACRIYPFAALLTVGALKVGAYMFDKSPCVIEAQRYAHPPQRGFTINHGLGTYLKKENVSMRTQDLMTVYHDAGTYMFITRDELNKPLAERTIKWIPTSDMDAQDVDTAEDLEMAKLKFMRRYL